MRLPTGGLTEMSFNPLAYPILFTTPRRLSDIPSWHGHIPFAFLLMEIMQPDVFVELGTFKGDSYCAFCQAVADLKTATRCHAVDLWEGDSHTGAYDSSVLSDLKAHHDPLYSPFSQLMRTTFDEAVEHFADGSIDLLHIDGLHTYDAVRHDYETWLPKLSDRAVVLFHDTEVRERDFGVYAFWEEVAGKGPAFRFTHSNGLGVLAVGKAVPEPVLNFLAAANAETAVTRSFFQALGERVTLHEAVERLTPEVMRYRHDVPIARDRIAAQDALISEQNQSIADLGARANHLQNEVTSLQNQLTSIVQSRSWRITAPLRAINGRFRQEP